MKGVRRMKSGMSNELGIKKAYATFMFPFAFHEKKRKSLMTTLTDNGFTFFKLGREELQDKYYGRGVKIIHEELDQYFLPYIEDKLFPTSTKNRGFLRYSKQYNDHFNWQLREDAMDFHLNSLDITLCPFGIGVVTLRVGLTDMNYTLSEVLNFISHFRVMEPKLREEKGVRIFTEGKEIKTTSELIMEHLCPSIKPFIVSSNKLAGYYGGLPFFEDERMLSSAFLIANEQEEITNEQLYRISRLDGKDIDGNPLISSNNKQYIDQYVQKHAYDRWAPLTYQIFSENTQMTVSVKPREMLDKEIAAFMSTDYYNLFLHYYYKVMLLRLSFEYSEITWVKDKEYVKELMERISKFYSRYFFGLISSRSEGKEITNFLRNSFQLEALFSEVSNTLNDLYRGQANQIDARQNALLFMLTIYTVVSGIYGMNLVIDDWKDFTNWAEISGYSFFEWVAFLTAISGIGIAIAILAMYGWNGVRDKYRKWKRSREM